ncbi:MAG: tetratricopeptide repeat protein, partial [Planctomycetota bacterium]
MIFFPCLSQGRPRRHQSTLSGDRSKNTEPVFNAGPVLRSAFLALFVLLASTSAQGQGDGKDNTEQTTPRVTERERITAERFLSVLIRRPRPGTALDRVVEFHQRAGTLDQLLESLVQQGDQADTPGEANTGTTGARAMVAGLVYLTQSNAAEAAKQFERAAELMPTDSVASYQHGVALLQIGELEDAAEALKQAVERKPARTEAMEVYTTLAQLYARAGDRMRSIEVWNDLQKQFPSDEKIASRIAEELARSGDAEEARKRFSDLARSTRREEDKLRFSVRAAEMLRPLGKPDEALEELTAALAQTRPGSWLSRDIVSRIEEGFTATGDFEGLAKHYQKQIEAAPENLALPMRLTRIWINLGRLKDAETVARSTLEKSPDNNEIRQSLVDVLKAGGKYADAADVQRQMLQSDPDNSDIAFALANTLASDPDASMQARQENAAAALTSFSKRRSDDALLLSQIAQRLKDLEQVDSAIELSRKAVEIDPTSIPYREYLGELLFQSDRKEDAIATWKSIAEGEQRGRETLVRLAEIFAAFELDELAVETWDEAGSFDLDFQTRLRWAEALSDAERHDRAVEVLEGAASIAETPDQRDALLVARINAYQSSGKLKDRIATVAAEEESPQMLRELAVLYQADKQETQAIRTITRAIELAPEDLSVMTVAADILKRQSRWGEAAEKFAKLAELDRRYQVNHLKQAVSMRVKLGQNDEAMEICQQIIQSSPGSVDSYTFAARTAQRLSREEEAIAILRTAMEVAPRDNNPRLMLASILSGRFDTDSAIRLYWEAFEIGGDEERTRIVTSLSPLYERRGEVDVLVERIESIGRTDRNLNQRKVGLLIVDTYQAIRYDGAVLRQVEELLLRSPRDVDLLKRAVSAADAADDLETAVDYARRLVEQADTPDNRMQLATLQWQNGQIEIDEFLKTRLSTIDSPNRISRMVQASLVRGDFSTARKACRFAIEKDSSLWDIRLYLAQINLHELLETVTAPIEVRELSASERSQRREKLREELIELCQSIRSESIPDTATPPTVQQNTKADPNRLLQWTIWNSSLRTLQRSFRLPPYDDSYYSRQPGVNLVVPLNHKHASAIAAAYLLAAQSSELQLAMGGQAEFDLESACKKLADTMEGWVLDDPTSGESMTVFLHDRLLRSFARSWADVLARAKLEGKALTDWNKNNSHGLSLSWNASLDARFAATRTDLQNGLPDLINHLRPRIAKGVFERKTVTRLESETDPEARKKLEKELESVQPLTKERIEELEKWAADWKALKRPKDTSTRVEHQALIWNEWMVVGETDRAEPFELVINDETSYAAQFQVLKWYYLFEWFDRVETSLPKVLASIRKTRPVRDQVAGYIGVYQSQTWRNPDRYREFVNDRLDVLLDIAIAQAARSAPSIRNCSLSAEGYFNKSVRNLAGGSSYARFRSPLLPSLLPDSLIYDFVQLCDRPSTIPYSQRETIEIPESLLSALEQKYESYDDEDLTPPPGVDPYEVDNETTRRHLEAQFTHALAAYVDWWLKKPERALPKIRRLHQANPQNMALALELSRLQAETGSPKDAIATLDSFEVLNSNTLLRKELAVLNLASIAGDQTRAARAAERLFGMRMDRSMQMALATQLQQLGMMDKAGEILARARRGRTSDVSTLLTLASSLAASNRDSEAAEVAYDALKRLSNRRTQQSNEDYYRQRAIRILKNSKRLDPIIAAAEKRYRETPKSNRLRTQLSELYAAAGEMEKLSELLKDAPKDSGDPRLQMAQAASLYKARKYDESAIAYAKAFVAAPTRASNEYYSFTNAYRSAKPKAKLEAIRELSKMDFSKIDSYRLDEFVRICSPNSYYGQDFARTGEEGKKVAVEYLESLLFSLRDDGAKANLLGSLPANYIEASEKIKAWFEEELLKPATFGPQGKFATVTSYSSNGVVNGSVERIINLMATERIRGKARELIDQALKDNPAPDEGFSADHSAALLFDLLLDTGIVETDRSTDDVDGDQEALLSRFETLVSRLPEGKLGTARQSNQTQQDIVSSELVWQAGQVLEQMKCLPKGDRRDRCLEKLYRYAYTNSSRDQFQYSPGPRWLAFAGKARSKREIRNEVWRVIRSTNFDTNVSNPGYGDYQLIEAYRSFADQFEKLECTIDSVSLLAELLEDPARFERASRWSGGQPREVYLARMSKLSETISAKEAGEYLASSIESIKKSDTDLKETSTEASVSRVALETVLSSDIQLDFALACQALASEKNAEEERSKLRKSLEQISAETSCRAATLRLAMELVGDDEATLATEFESYLATLPEKLPEERIVDAAILLRLASEKASSFKYANQLLERLLTSASQGEALQERLKQLLQSETDRQAALISKIEAAYAADEKALLGSALFDEGFRLAVDAASDGRLSDSLDLASLVLKRGLPIRSSTTSNITDAFAVRQSSGSSNPFGEQTNQRLSDIDRVLSLVDQWSNELGFEDPLTRWPMSFSNLTNSSGQRNVFRMWGYTFSANWNRMKSDDAGNEPADPGIDEAKRDDAVKMLNVLTELQRVAPADVGPGFAARVMTDLLRGFNSSRGNAQFRSLEIARSRLALALGQTDRLQADGGEVEPPTATLKLRRSAERLEQAHAQLDAEQIRDGITKLIGQLEGQIPKVDEVIEVQTIQSYTSEMLAT